MDSVGSFVKLIIAVTFLWSIFECLVPKSNMHKYSEFIYGIIIISITLSLVVNIYDMDYSFAYNGTDMTSEYNHDYIKQLYEERLEKILSEKFDDSSIKIELTDDYKIKSIDCDSKKTYDAIMGYLNE